MKDMANIETLKKWIDESSNIVFFGGAGVSTESGIPDFRSVDGLYNQKYDYPPETILSHTFFVNHPKEFFKFYRDKMIVHDVAPNRAHLALAKLEKEGKLKAVITQNIDGLHQAAGSRNVIELHGTIHKNHCMDCGRPYGLEAVEKAEAVPHCECGGIIKPAFVGEDVFGHRLSVGVIGKADESTQIQIHRRRIEQRLGMGRAFGHHRAFIGKDGPGTVQRQDIAGDGHRIRFRIQFIVVYDPRRLGLDQFIDRVGFGAVPEIGEDRSLLLAVAGYLAEHDDGDLQLTRKALERAGYRRYDLMARRARIEARIDKTDVVDDDTVDLLIAAKHPRLSPEIAQLYIRNIDYVQRERIERVIADIEHRIEEVVPERYTVIQSDCHDDRF